MDSTSASDALPPSAARLRAALDAVARDPSAREIVRRWRGLTGGDRTVLGCSGGADSCALTLALAASVPPQVLVVAHVVHDMRPLEHTHADREFVRDLAGALDLPFDERAVSLPQHENAEAAARRLRYGALADLARAHGSRVVATGHHAEDQLETMLLALLRGAGSHGLAGMRPRRRLAEGITLVRPMLQVSRADAERICALAGVRWRTDDTNADTSRARAALRLRVLPALLELRPSAARSAARSADLLAQAALMLDERVESVFGDADHWPREALRAEPALVVGEGLRRAFARATGGATKDRLSQRMVGQAVACIRSNSGETKVFQWPSGVRVRVDAAHVALTSPC